MKNSVIYLISRWTKEKLLNEAARILKIKQRDKKDDYTRN